MTNRTVWTLEARLAWRYGLVAMFAALAAGWTALLVVLPPAGARAAAPWLLMLETALVGTTLAGALVILERDQGMRAALAMSPVRPGDRLAAKVGVLTALVVASSVPIALAGRPIGAGGLAAALVGVSLTTVLTTLLAVAVAAHRQSVLTFMIALPLVLLPLLVPAVVHAAGLGHRLLYLVPTTGAMDLVRSGYGDPAAGPGWSVAWLVAACLAAAGLARRQLRRLHSGGRARSPGRVSTRAARTGRSGGGPVWSFLRTDLVNIRRDPLLLLIATAPPLLGLAIRSGYPPVHGWLADSHGFDLDPYRPLLLAAVILLPVQTFGMVGAMLVLDDVDDRALVALRTSPLTLPRYLGYRAGLVTVAGWAGLVAAALLSGLAPVSPRLVAAVLLAGLITPVFMLAALALARNKVEGVAALKLLGLPIFVPAVAWWLTGPAGWLFAAIPTWWVLQSLWTSWWYALGGAVLTGAALALLARRVLGRLAAP